MTIFHSILFPVPDNLMMNWDWEEMPPKLLKQCDDLLDDPVLFFDDKQYAETLRKLILEYEE